MLFPFDATDGQLINYALLMWRNTIQTGNPCTSSADLINIGDLQKIRQLNEEQQDLCIRLEELARMHLHDD